MKIKILITALLLFVATATQADFVQFGQELWMDGGVFIEDQGGTSSLLSLDTRHLSGIPKFDSSMGALTEVRLSLSQEIWFDWSVYAEPIGSFGEMSVSYLIGQGFGVPIGGSIKLKSEDLPNQFANCESNGGPCMNDGFESFVSTPGESLFGSEMDAFLGTGNLANVTVELLG